MASRLLLLPRLGFPLAVGLGASSAFAAHHFCQPAHARLLRCDDRSMLYNPQGLGKSGAVPTIKDSRSTRRVVRQISTGSITGLLGGIAVSIFSKSLAVLIGLLVVGVQAIESRGFHIVPYGRLQKYFTNVDIKSALQDNVALKLSFGLTFALAAFAELK